MVITTDDWCVYDNSLHEESLLTDGEVPGKYFTAVDVHGDPAQRLVAPACCGRAGGERGQELSGNRKERW